MPTRRIDATARARAARLPVPVWERVTSAMASPTLITGLSAESGSWKIMAMALPRMELMARSSRPVKLTPSKLIRPLTCAPGGSSPRTARTVRLLPEPLSPTSATASPGATASDRSLTAARCASKTMSRCSMARPRSVVIEAPDPVGQAIPDQADEQADEDDGKPREDDHPRRREHEAARLGDHGAPFWCRRLHAEAEEAQRGTDLDVEGEIAHRKHDRRRNRVRQDMAEHDAHRPEAEIARRQNIFARAQRQHL